MDNKILEQTVNTTGEDREKLDKIIAEHNMNIIKTGVDERQQLLANSMFTLDKEIRESWDKFNH